MVFFYKIVKGLVPSYLQSCLLPDNERTYNTRSSLRNTIKAFATWRSTFRATFFPYCTKEWNQLNDGIKKIELIKKFKKMLIKIIRAKENTVFGDSDIYGVKLLTRLRLNFSHLNKHNFRHNFKDTINPMCNCGPATETTINYLLCCQLYSVQKVQLLYGVYKLDSSLKKYALNVNKEILRLTINYLKATGRFV